MPVTRGDHAGDPPVPLRLFTTTQARRESLRTLAILLVLFATTTVLLRRSLTVLAEPTALREFILAFGILAPAVFVAVQALQVVAAPIPGQALGFVAGYLFGSLLGTGYSLLGAAIGTLVAVAISRRYGRPYVERVVHPPTLEAFDAACQRRGLLAIFVIFLVPGLPDDVVCFIGGLTTIGIRRLVAVSILGRLPGYLLVATAGNSVATGNYDQAALLVAIVAAASLLGWHSRRRILAWLAAEPAPDGSRTDAH